MTDIIVLLHSQKTQFAERRVKSMQRMRHSLASKHTGTRLNANIVKKLIGSVL